MTTAWTITALNRLKSELEGDATLSTYVDTVEIWERDRPSEVPDLNRHAIAIIPQSISVEADSTASNLERFTVLIRLFVAVWDPVHRLEALTGETVVGVGTSEVGILQFLRDVQECLRMNSLSDLVEQTGREADGVSDIATVESEDRDRTFMETTITWTGEFIAMHDGSRG